MTTHVAELTKPEPVSLAHGAGLPAADGAAPDLTQSVEVVASLEQLNLLVKQAREVAALADDGENPEAENDKQRAMEAADTAAAGRREILAVARRGDRVALAGTIQRSLGSARTALANVIESVEEHEHPSGVSSSERVAHESSVAAKETAKAAVKNKSASPLLPKKNKSSEEVASEQQTPQERAQAKRVAAAKRYRGENDDNDERDDEVGKGKDRRARKATSGTGRKATRMITNGSFGMISENTADEIVSTAGTGVQRMNEGATGFMSGDVKKSDEGALATGRGVRNVIRDDLGLNANLAQTVGRATTATLQTMGRGGAYVANKSDDTRDYAADKYQMMWKFGRELNDLLGGLQANAKTRAMYDTDKDGKVELHEVVNKLKTYGIHDMKNIDFNGDGNITYAEIGAAIRSRGKPPAKQ